jgi:hypothetical protein
MYLPTNKQQETIMKLQILLISATLCFSQVNSFAVDSQSKDIVSQKHYELNAFVGSDEVHLTKRGRKMKQRRKARRAGRKTARNVREDARKAGRAIDGGGARARRKARQAGRKVGRKAKKEARKQGRSNAKAAQDQKQKERDASRVTTSNLEQDLNETRESEAVKAFATTKPVVSTTTPVDTITGVLNNEFDFGGDEDWSK